jgi:hypothetical protein
MIVIRPNKKNIYYRVVIMVALWIFSLYFYRHLVQGEWNVVEIVNLIGIGLATLYYTPVVIMATLFRPVKVILTPEGLVAVKILTGKQTLTFPEIDSFGTRSFQSANGREERVEINYKGNRRLNIANVNVETITPILEALRGNNIPYTGHTEKEARFFKR